MESKKKSKRHNKRFFQFGLKTFLAVVTGFCICLGTIKTQADRQAKIIEQVRQINGLCRYDYQLDESGHYDPTAVSYVPQQLLNLLGVDFFHDVEEVQFYQANSYGYRFLKHVGSMRNEDMEWRIFLPDRQKVADQVMEDIQTLESLRSISLRPMNDMDSIFENRLAKLKKLERITVLKGSDLSDSGIASLKNLENLKSLSVQETRIGDPSLEALGTMKNLETLYLSGHYFSDEGVKHLGNLENLDLLCIDGPQQQRGKRSLIPIYNLFKNQTSDVSDDGLAELLNLKKLTKLSCCRTRASEDIVAKFKTAIPGCTVHR